jgi:hypothetical protein
MPCRAYEACTRHQACTARTARSRRKGSLAAGVPRGLPGVRRGRAQSLPSARTPLSESHGRNRSHPGRALPCLDGLGGMRRSNARRCAVAHSGARRRFVPAAPSGAHVTTLALICLLLAFGTRPGLTRAGCSAERACWPLRFLFLYILTEQWLASCTSHRLTIAVGHHKRALI